MTQNTIKENPEQITQINKIDYKIDKNNGIGGIAEALGIRLTSLNDALAGLKIHSGLIRLGDTYSLVRMSDGTGTLSILRAGRNIGNVELSKESLYQDIEKGPDNFDYIEFHRVPNKNYYTLHRKDGLELHDTKVETVNLDAFRVELARIAPALITECSGRQMQHELACSIKTNDDPHMVMLNSIEWWDFRPSRVDTTRIMSMFFTDGKKDPVQGMASLVSLIPGITPQFIKPQQNQIAQK